MAHSGQQTNVLENLRNLFPRQKGVVIGQLTSGQKTNHVETVAPNQPGFEMVEQLPENTDENCTIQLMSDLHLEMSFIKDGTKQSGYEDFDCTPVSPTLALLGDIGVVSNPGLFIFLRRQLRHYRRIFFVMGNHEYYSSTQESALADMKAFASGTIANDSIGEFILLDRTRYDFNEHVTILGCTLWSKIPESQAEIVSYRVNDFRSIQNWSVESHNAAHTADAEWLDCECNRIRQEEPHRKIIIFTHHAPSFEGTSAPRYNTTTNSIRCAFATDMSSCDCWASPVALWAFGHTHFNANFVSKDGIRVISNQRGYELFESHRTGFLATAVIDVETMRMCYK